MTHITIDPKEVVRLACDLIAIESHRDAPGREAAIGRFLVDWFRERGIEADLVPAADGRSNVIARLWLSHPALDEAVLGRTLLLNGHIDTVPAGAMRDAFAPRIEDGVLWGRGACDMKGAVAAMCCVLAAVHRSQAARKLPDATTATPGGGPAMDCVLAAYAKGEPRRDSRHGASTCGSPGSKLGGGACGPSADGLGRSCAPLCGSLIFGGTVDEETGSLGVKRLVESGLNADYAVVGEPTCLRAAIAHKGACFIRITLVGRGAHGSCPEKGVSATSYGARILAALEDELRPRIAKRTYPLLGASTVSVGRICGGTEPNIVAERCELDVDRRTLPGETDALAEVCELVASICDNVDGLTYDVVEMDRTSIVPHVALGTPPASKLAQACAAACRDAGLPGEPVGVTYWTDGAHLASNGIETVILGPGDIANAHGPNDHVAVADIIRAADLYLRIAQTLLGSGS
ncbi:MAG: M20/M25/M40 family metallo-hydrolase [Candidatus Bipolaricaulota bacterium]|nr:M20/M25/M40 family metallo-hydrolase [Candidatus Bipolaricaulota bacterium]